MVRNGRRPITSTRPVRLAVVVAVVVLLSGMWVARAHAAVSADLSVAISGPTSALSGSPFAYAVEVTNLGPDEADSATLLLDLPTGATGVSASCTASSGGAACPTAVQMASGQASATLSTMPASSAVVITVTGLFGSGVTATVSAAVTSSAPDPDPSGNSASLVTCLDPTSAEAVVSTTVDPTTAAFGQTITYSTRVTNTGPTDLVGLSLESRFSALWQGAQHGLTMTGTVSCAASAADAAPCPTGLSEPHPYDVAFIGQDATVVLSGVSLPAGKTLYLTVAVAFRTWHCDWPHDRQLANTVTISVPHVVSLGTSVTGTGTVVTLSSCAEPSPSSPPTTPTPSPSTSAPIPSAPSQPVPSPTHPVTTATRRASVSPTSAAPTAAPPTLELPPASASSSPSATTASPRPATDPGRVQVFTGPTDNGGGVALAVVGAVVAIAGAGVALRRP